MKDFGEELKSCVGLILRSYNISKATLFAHPRSSGGGGGGEAEKGKGGGGVKSKRTDQIISSPSAIIA